MGLRSLSCLIIFPLFEQSNEMFFFIPRTMGTSCLVQRVMQNESFVNRVALFGFCQTLIKQVYCNPLVLWDRFYPCAVVGSSLESSEEIPVSGSVKLLIAECSLVLVELYLRITVSQTCTLNSVEYCSWSCCASPAIHVRQFGPWLPKLLRQETNLRPCACCYQILRIQLPAVTL